MNNYDCRFICSYILASCYIGNIKNKSGDYEKIKQKLFFHFQHNTTNQHHHSMISQGVYIYILSDNDKIHKRRTWGGSRTLLFNGVGMY
jgi:hypothetical protein